MKQIIKKTAAFLLSFSLIFSVFVFNFSALTPEKFVINECDSLEGWVGSNLQPTNDQAQACNSAAAISRNSNYGVFIGGYEPAEPIDISDYTYIEWDMMFMLNGDTTGAMWEQILAAYSSTGTNNTLFLRLSSNGNKSERAIWRSSAIEVTQPYANKNWFHFKAAIDNPNDAGTFDPAKMTEFYFTTCDAGETYFDKSIGSGVIRIDNIYATGLKEQPVVPGDANGDGVTDLLDLIRIKKYLAGTVSEISAGADMNSNGIVNNFDMVCLRKLLLGVDYTSDVEPVETVTITDCETEDGWTQESNNTGLELQPGRGVGGTGAIYAYGGYGALRKITYTLNTPIDLSGTATLEWDQYTVVQSGENLGMEQFETVYKAYKDYAAVAVSDGAVEVAFSVSKWQVGEPGEGNYRHIAVSLADSGLNLANIESITFYTLPQNVGQLDTSVPTAVFRFDNIIATSNPVTPNFIESEEPEVPEEPTIPDIVITPCDSTDGWEAESSATGLTISPTNGIDGGAAIYAAGGYGALRKITYTLSSVLDLTNNSTLEWDQYTVVQGGDNNGLEQFMAVYESYQDYAAVAVSDGTETVEFKINKWEIGEVGARNFRHIAVSLADSGLDLSNIVSVSFYTLPNGVGSPVTTVPSAIFRFDNIIATANTVTPNWSGSSSVPDDDNIPDVDISKCEDKTGWSYANGDNNIINGTNLGIDGTYVSVATGFGALRELKFTPTVPLDLTDTPSVEWDMVITETSNGLEYFYAAAEAYSASAGIKVSDGSNTVLVGVDEWEVGTPDANKWRHIAASLAGKGLNLSNIVSLTFVTCPVGQSADSTLSDNVIYRLDNIIATNNTVEPNWEGSGDNTGTAFMPSLFGNGMIFQQNKDMNLWGITDQPNESVEAKLYKGAQLVETQTAVSDSDGNWSLAFSPRKGSYDEYSISVSAGNQSKQISNVVIGELWIASGQSNMEFFLGNTVTDKSTIPLDEYIRVFKEPSVPTPDGANGVLSSVPVYDIVPDTNNANSIGKAVWTDASREIDIRYVSGVAYYTCLELREKLDVPVGFINTAKGASVIESWLSRESIDSNPTVKDKLEEKSLYMSERGLSAPKNWQYMTTLYNTKLAPIAGLDSENNKRSEHAGFNIAGVMWYQGESNIKYAEDNGSNPFYTAALNQLIDDWSVIFGYEKGKMPFVVVDIAAYDYSNVRQSDYDYIIPMLSEAMSDACDAHAGTAVHIPIYDLPLTYMNPPKVDYHPIHPSNKQPVGERLAAAMLDRFYGEDSFAAPVFKEVAVSEGKLIITLDDVGTGIKIKNNGSVLYGFAICGADRVFVNADAKIISANQIEVSSPYVDSPVAATYAFSSYNASANLVSSFDIPCLPFRTDRVESVYLGVDDWMSADIEEVWSSSWKTLVGDMYDTWITSTSGASISFDTQIKASGTSSIKLTTTAANKGVGPNLSLSSIRNHLNDYKYLAVTVKNDDNVQKTLKLQIGSGAYALTVDGKQGAELAAGSDFTTYVFDISQLVGLNGNTLSATMSNNAFAQDEITFILDTAGTVHIDEIRLATEI